VIVERECCRCGVVKPIAEFYSAAAEPTGFAHACKTCEKARKSTQRKAPEQRRRETKNRNEWGRRNPAKRRAARVRQKYGLTASAFAAMVAAHGGHCACCGGDPHARFGLAVDHDHETGTVRALLCIKCNAGLGFFDDSPERLELAAAYLRRFKLATVAVSL